jgi:hypothetical protein
MPRLEGIPTVTDPDAADERLRQAFQRLGETSREEPSAEDVDRIWRAAAGDLSADERRELVDRTATDPALAEAWRAAKELSRAAPVDTPAATAGSRFSTPGWLAAAAVLLVGVALGVIAQLSPPRDGTYRDVGTDVIAPLVEPDATLPRDAFRLRWTAGPPDSRYLVRVTTEDLRVLTTVPDLTVPELVLDPGLLSSIDPGARVLWQVDATLPGGERVSSETFVVRVQ